jgi:hypothetical protein
MFNFKGKKAKELGPDDLGRVLFLFCPMRQIFSTDEVVKCHICLKSCYQSELAVREMKQHFPNEQLTIRTVCQICTEIIAKNYEMGKKALEHLLGDHVQENKPLKTKLVMDKEGHMKLY